MTPIAAIALPASADPGITVPAPGPPFEGLLAAATLATPFPGELPASIPTMSPRGAATADPPLDPTPEALLLSTAARVVPVQLQPRAAVAVSATHPPTTEQSTNNHNKLDDDADAEDEPVTIVLVPPSFVQPIVTPVAGPLQFARITRDPALIDAPVTPVLPASVTASPLPVTGNAPAPIPPAARPNPDAAPAPTELPTAPQPTPDNPAPNRELAPSSASPATQPSRPTTATPPTPVAMILPPALPQLPLAIATPKLLEARPELVAQPTRRRDPVIALQLSTPASFPPDRQPILAEPRLAPVTDAANPPSVDATVRAHAANAIELATDRLGAVRLAFDASDTAVRVHVTAERPATASLIVAQADRLQVAVETGGTRLSGLSVDVRDGGDPRRQLPWQQPGQDHPVPQPRRANPSEVTRPARQDRFA